MKIENLRSEKRADRARVAASLIWEDCDRPPYELYFETEEEFAESLSCNPHAFLVGCIVPAMHYGERRVAIDAEICPELRQGLITAMSWLRHWYYEPDRELVRIEAKTQSRPPAPIPPRAGFFFSGGIDSFATLRLNRLNFPPTHAGSIKDGLLVYGLELDDLQAFGYVKEVLSRVAQEVGITLIPVYTNVYLNYRKEDAKHDFSFWIHEFSGAALCSVAHAFAKRLNVVSIASSNDIPHQAPYGSAAVLDPNYSSADSRIRHDGIEYSRMAKTKLIADWDLALRHLRVCNHFARYEPTRLNCARCEKCMRTMLSLLAIGALDRTPAFSVNEVSPDMVLKAVTSIPDPEIELSYRAAIPGLTEAGRIDLVRAVKRAIRRSKRKTIMLQLRGRYFVDSIQRLSFRNRERRVMAHPDK